MRKKAQKDVAESVTVLERCESLFTHNTSIRPTELTPLSLLSRRQLVIDLETRALPTSVYALLLPRTRSCNNLDVSQANLRPIERGELGETEREERPTPLYASASIARGVGIGVSRALEGYRRSAPQH